MLYAMVYARLNAVYYMLYDICCMLALLCYAMIYAMIYAMLYPMHRIAFHPMVSLTMPCLFGFKGYPYCVFCEAAMLPMAMAQMLVALSRLCSAAGIIRPRYTLRTDVLVLFFNFDALSSNISSETKTPAIQTAASKPSESAATAICGTIGSKPAIHKRLHPKKV